MMFNIGRLFHINKKNKYLFMNDLEVITRLCGLKNVKCPNPGYTSITWVDIEFISEKNRQWQFKELHKQTHATLTLFK